MNKRAGNTVLRYDQGIVASVAEFEWAATTLPIRYLGDEVLRTVCTPVEPNEFKSAAIGQIVSDLTNVLTAYRARRGTGRGLAANQIGHTRRMAVLWLSDRPELVINPRVISSHGLASYHESCLSSGMLIGEVHRPWLGTFAYQDATGSIHTLEANEMQTRVLLHEIDHLDGISCTDRYEPKTMRFVRAGKTEILGSKLTVLSR